MHLEAAELLQDRLLEPVRVSEAGVWCDHVAPNRTSPRAVRLFSQVPVTRAFLRGFHLDSHVHLIGSDSNIGVSRSSQVCEVATSASPDRLVVDKYV